MVLRLIIPHWTPATMNQLMRHWRIAHRLKRIDRNLIMGYCFLYRLPIATGPRRVDLTITRPRSQRGRVQDPDAFFKSVNDALVHAKMLIDDSRRWVQLGSVTFEQGPERATTITLTDLDGEHE